MTGTRGAATAAAIEDAALDLVLERGHENVTVDMICEAAGVSQRTFFNHFPTKDDAVLGQEAHSVDEQAARRFLVSTGPLVQDALTLVTPPSTGRSAERMVDRMRAISSAPVLLAGHLARIAAIDSEVRDLVMLRLGQHAPEQDERRRLDEAEMVAASLVAVMRWVAITASRDGEGSDFAALIDRAQSTLDDVFRASLPAGAPGRPEKRDDSREP